MKLKAEQQIRTEKKTELTIPLQVESEMQHYPGFKGHAIALQAGRTRPGRAERKRTQRQSSSCSGQARLTGGTGRGRGV